MDIQAHEDCYTMSSSISTFEFVGVHASAGIEMASALPRDLASSYSCV
jgi:hypothetical protein